MAAFGRSQQLYIDGLYVVSFLSAIFVLIFNLWKFQRRWKVITILALLFATFLLYFMRDVWVYRAEHVDFLSLGTAPEYITAFSAYANSLLLFSHYIYIEVYFERSLLFKFTFMEK